MSKKVTDFQVGKCYTNTSWGNNGDFLLWDMNARETKGCVSKNDKWLMLGVVDEHWIEVLTATKSGFLFAPSMSSDTKEFVL